jgi:8-oxo-dGTP pyrophosphatase MutT (NUDIX family)
MPVEEVAPVALLFQNTPDGRIFYLNAKDQSHPWGSCSLWQLFGGAREEEDTSNLNALYRELYEELGLVRLDLKRSPDSYKGQVVNGSKQGLTWTWDVWMFEIKEPIVDCSEGIAIAISEKQLRKAISNEETHYRKGTKEYHTMFIPGIAEAIKLCLKE